VRPLIHLLDKLLSDIFTWLWDYPKANKSDEIRRSILNILIDFFQAKWGQKLARGHIKKLWIKKVFVTSQFCRMHEGDKKPQR